VSERPAPVGRLLEDLRSLDRAYSTGHHGRWSGRRRAELVDGCLRDLAAAAGMPEDVALVALGGYGRGTLAPGSDLDLLILHEGSADAVSQLAERLLYPLWDAGLQVGHAVRTAEVCFEIAAERLDATTAMLDGRLLAGSAPGWDEVRSAVLAPVRGDPIAFAQRLVADRDARRERFGSVSSLLEPELKEGVGGLRDVHALGWVRTAIGRPLEEGGILSEAERRSVDGADEFLTRVRSALHLETGRGSDRLLAEQQPSIAAAMGFADEPGLPAVDGLMRSVFEQARQVEHVTASVFDRFLRGTSPPGRLDATPEGILRAFASSARDGHVMPAASLDAMSAVAIDAERPWTGPTRSAFLELLRCGPAAIDALETLDRIGLLERYVPAWGPVRCRPQRDPYHRSSVDVHLLATLAGAARLLEDPGDDPSVALRSGWSRTLTRCGSARSCTTSARSGRGTTSKPGRASPARRSTTWVRPARPPTSRCSSSRSTCSCRTRRPAATSTTSG
jgi:[protein-PII] uridylyltransferase